MNITAKHIAAAAALLVVGFVIGRKQALTAKAASPAAHNETTGQPEQWWSFAGQWSTF